MDITTGTAAVLERKEMPAAAGGTVVVDPTDVGVVEAYVSVTGVRDEHDDVIEPGAYADTLRRRTPKGIWSHKWDDWVAKTEHVTELMPGDSRLPAKTRNGDPWPAGAGALLVKHRYNLETEAGRQAYADVKFFADQCEWSIDYVVPPGGAERKDGVRHIHTIELFAFSPVLFGANSLTATRSIKSLVGDGPAAEPDDVREAKYGPAVETKDATADPAGDATPAEQEPPEAAAPAADATTDPVVGEADAAAAVEPDGPPAADAGDPAPVDGEPESKGKDGGSVSDTPWSQFSASDYTPEQWRRACLVDTGDGAEDSKDRYKLPVREPDGTLNRNGVHAAAGALAGSRGGVDLSADQRTKAEAAVRRLYGQIGEDPPASLGGKKGLATGGVVTGPALGDGLLLQLCTPYPGGVAALVAKSLRERLAEIGLAAEVFTGDDDAELAAVASKADRTADTPSQVAAVERLKRWYVEGADGKIQWGKAGDFDQCVKVAGQHMTPGKAKGFCALRHRDATGEWPGPNAHGGKKDAAGGWAPELERPGHGAAFLEPAQAKYFPRFDGSFEQRRDQLEAAITDLFSDSASYASVIIQGTFPDYVVADVYRYPASGNAPIPEGSADLGSFRIPYGFDDAGEVSLGAPEPVEVSLVAEVESAAEDAAEAAEPDIAPLANLLASLVGQAKTVAAALRVGTKAGRVLSARNETAIREALTKLVSVLVSAGVDLSNLGAAAPAGNDAPPADNQGKQTPAGTETKTGEPAAGGLVAIDVDLLSRAAALRTATLRPAP